MSLKTFQAQPSVHISLWTMCCSLGKIDIDLERKLVIHSEKDKDIWRAKKVDPQDIAEARKYGSSERKVIKSTTISFL